jgi:serine/threonine protein kinase
VGHAGGAVERRARLIAYDPCGLMALPSGTRVGPYEIVSAIGAGGMGEVYRARDPKLQRDVAIKLLPAASSNPDAVDRFQREARAVAALNHPNIVTIYGVEDGAGQPFLAMELIDGDTIAHSIPSHGLPLDLILEYAIPLADALTAAHAQGITHRDLKPSNVMLTRDRRIKVLDFGLAKLRQDAVQIDAAVTTRGLTGQGQIIGTVAYMSPEQATGTPVDHRTDLFSFGVMLYEMATGQRPFAGDSSVAVIAAILKDQPPPVTDVRPDLPREFSRIVRRALAKNPEQRYQTAKDLRNDLQTLKDDVTSGELSRPAPSARRSRSSLIVWISVAAAVLVIIAAGYYLFMHGQGPSKPPPAEAVTLDRLTSSGKASLAAISPDGKYVVHVVFDAEGSSLWIRQTATGSNVRILPPGPERYGGLTFSPDGNYVYFCREDGRLTFSAYRIATLGGTPQPILRDVDSAVAISPDGSRFAFVRAGPRAGKVAILIAYIDGSNVVELASRDIQSGFPIYSGIAWSPDGLRLVVPLGGFSGFGGVGEARLVIIDIASKTERPLTPPRWHSLTGLAWLPDGGIIASAAETGKPNYQLWRVSSDDGSLSRLTNDLNSYVGVSSAGAAASIVTVQADESSTLSVSEAGGGGPLKAVTTGPGRYDGRLGLTWTPDGRLIYSSAASGPLHLWMSGGDGSQARQMTSTPAIEEQPSACPDSHTIVFVESVGGRRGLTRLDVSTGRAAPLTSDPTDARPHCMPDGRSVVFSRTTQTGATLHRIALDGTGVTPVLPIPAIETVISPDGRFVAGMGPVRPGVIAVLPLDGVEPSRGFNIVSLPVMIRFSPRGDALTFLESRKGPPALWTQPLDGGSPNLLLDMHGETVFGFAWSRDGRLVIAHGPAPTDVVLMSGIK